MGRFQVDSILEPEPYWMSRLQDRHRNSGNCLPEGALEGVAVSKRSGSVGPFLLDEKMFGKNLRSSERGVAGGRSEMTTDLERRWRCPRH